TGATTPSRSGTGCARSSPVLRTDRKSGRSPRSSGSPWSPAVSEETRTRSASKAPSRQGGKSWASAPGQESSRRGARATSAPLVSGLAKLARRLSTQKVGLWGGSRPSSSRLSGRRTTRAPRAGKSVARVRFPPPPLSVLQRSWAPVDAGVVVDELQPTPIGIAQVEATRRRGVINRATDGTGEVACPPKNLVEPRRVDRRRRSRSADVPASSAV